MSDWDAQRDIEAEGQRAAIYHAKRAQPASSVERDVRRELAAQHDHGPDTYVGQLCRRASEMIRRLENENYDMRERLAKVRSLADVSRL